MDSSSLLSLLMSSFKHCIFSLISYDFTKDVEIYSANNACQWLDNVDMYTSSEPAYNLRPLLGHFYIVAVLLRMY